MKSAKWKCACAALALSAATLSASPQARAENLSINSTPPGATLELDGVMFGKTPYKVK
jgi:hypothetical protein